MSDGSKTPNAIVPENVEQLRQAVADHSSVLPIGNGTKQPLCCCNDATLVSLRSLSGIIQYEPSEFTFTAWAGTTISEINQTLLDKRQYLPFDPMLVDAGATIGGTIASGLSGPGRFRYGGIRDFLIGVKLLAGNGEMVQGGGKVVKNAAGFDLPKFLVGSLGHYASMVEVTFKVFPKPPSTCTLRLQCESDEEAMKRVSLVATSRWEADAVDYRPSDRTLFIRLRGPDGAIQKIAEEIRANFADGELMEEDQAERFWQSIIEMQWPQFDAPLIVKVPTTSQRFLSLQSMLQNRPGVSTHLSVAGGVCWIALADQSHIDWLDEQLRTQHLAGLIVQGPTERSRVGWWPTSQMQQAVKQAMDPQSKYAGV